VLIQWTYLSVSIRAWQQDWPITWRLKKAPEKVGMLKQMYEEEFQRALSQDEERASFRIAPDLRGYNIA
jgi:hypothetical protein